MTTRCSTRSSGGLERPELHTARERAAVLGEDVEDDLGDVAGGEARQGSPSKEALGENSVATFPPIP